MGLEAGPSFGVAIGTLIGLALLIWLALFLLRLWFQGPTKGTDNQRLLDNKVVVITGMGSTYNVYIVFKLGFSSGGTSGIGKVTAHDMSKRGAKVIMLCRNVDKAEQVAEEIRQETKTVVVVRELDLASLASVRTCAAKLMEEEDQIDILINNAGKFQKLPKDPILSCLDCQV